MISRFDDLLNQITMYRLVLYGLSLIAIVALTLSATGALDFEPLALVTTATAIMATGFVVNQALQRWLSIPANDESGIISCLILFFLLSPSNKPEDLLVYSLVTIIALASKFFITYRRKHIFNPAAFGVVVVGLAGFGHASWWVGSAVLWPSILILGLLVARKIRRVSMVVVFWLVSLTIGMAMAIGSGVAVAEQVEFLILSSPLIFLGSIMLTEPSTMPPKRHQQYVFAVITAALFAAHPGSGILHAYPETALLLANIYAFAVSDRRRYLLKYVTRSKQGLDGYDLEFTSDSPLAFTSGQYLEITLPLKNSDSRGNRRTFTIASSSREERVHIGVRIPDQPSRFKQELNNLRPGQIILAGQIAGSFILPSDTSRKLLFIAGGIGITPFRSMLQYLADTNEKRDVVLIYAARTKQDFMYKSVIDGATKRGLKVIYLPGSRPVATEQIAKYVPDIVSRQVYVSGPSGMTAHFKSAVRKLGVPRRSVSTDYFAGY